VGTSFGGGTIPSENVVRSSDFLLLHGNGVSRPADIATMVRKTRAVPGGASKPILFNEDDHFAFDQPTNNFLAALGEHASWGYFDFRMKDEGFDDGYQSVPVNWGISSPRKRGFFHLLREIAGGSASVSGVSVVRTNYHGWEGSLRMSNGQVETTIVPIIGRVMQFSFVGEEGVFWENRALDGTKPDATQWATTEWINFGGDKSWPSPEGDWSKFTKRDGWRPPPAFDAMPAEATLEGSDVVLTSPVDPFFGIRVQRRIQLSAVEPVMTITTTFERVHGASARIGIWVITQLKEPVGLYLPVPSPTRFGSGYATVSRDPPPDMKVDKGLLSLTRDPKIPHKIGSDASTLLWVGEKFVVQIDSARVLGAEYPDQGSSVEVYTNPDPLKYIELETLGSLSGMKMGDRIERTNTYRLGRRSEVRAEAEARERLGR
jgi:hypothetical protein